MARFGALVLALSRLAMPEDRQYSGTMTKHVLGASLLALLFGCGGGAAKPTETPKAASTISERKVRLSGELLFLLEAVKVETPPPGWKPAEFEINERRGTSLPMMDRPSPRLFTSAVADSRRREYARIEHVDDSEPFYAVKEDDRTLRAYVPIVGPNGEPLTQIYRAHPGTLATDPSDLAPLGGPLPRVARWFIRRDDSKFHPISSSFEIDRLLPGFVFTIPVAGSKDLVQLLDDNGAPVPFPKGVVGLVGVRRDPKDRLINDWGGWLVRWEGEKGDGWSLLTEPSLAKLDPSGPRWKQPVERLRAPHVQAIGGIRDDGACELTMTHVDAGSFIPRSLAEWTAATCAEGVKALSDEIVAIEGKRQVAEKVVAARKNAEREEQLALASKLEKQRKDRRADDAKRQEREAPILVKWRDELRTGRREKACELAKTLSPSSHAKAYADQTMFDPDVAQSDYLCLASRNDLSTSDKSVADAAHDRRARELAQRQEVKAPIGQGKLRDLGSSGPSAAERLKQTNDYTYGSGRASTCPYTDRSLCR